MLPTDPNAAPVEAQEPPGPDLQGGHPQPGWTTDPGQVLAIMAQLMGADQEAFKQRQQAAMGISAQMLSQSLAPQTLDGPGGVIPQPPSAAPPQAAGYAGVPGNPYGGQ